MAALSSFFRELSFPLGRFQEDLPGVPRNENRSTKIIKYVVHGPGVLNEICEVARGPVGCL